MKAKRKQSGISLTEMVVVIAVVALLTTLSLPAARTFFNSLGAPSNVTPMISAALANGRAIAAKNQRYAGVRFQQDPNGNQYMIFIVHEEPSKMDNLTIGFRAVEGIKPIKLPDTIGVMDLMINGSAAVVTDVDITNNNDVNDTTTFSILFSPSGKLVIHDVRARNNDGKNQPADLSESDDQVFNSPVNIANNNTGMFIQDDYPAFGFGEEPSRNRFIIYDKTEFKKVAPDRRYTDYLVQLVPEMIYINPYTGTIINK